MYPAFLVSLALSASAGDIDNCYTQAEAQNPGLTLVVSTANGPTLSFTDMDMFFDAVAQHHGESSLSVSYNRAGRTAVRQAMNCMLQHNSLTLSSVVINERFPDLAVRSTTIDVYEGSMPAGNLVLSGIAASCSSDAALRFVPAPGSSTTRELLLNAAFRGYDLTVDIAAPSTPAPCIGFCEVGECLGVCDFDDPDSDGACLCGGHGPSCAGDIPTTIQPHIGSWARATW